MRWEDVDNYLEIIRMKNRLENARAKKSKMKK